VQKEVKAQQVVIYNIKTFQNSLVVGGSCDILPEIKHPAVLNYIQPFEQYSSLFFFY
jgi:hypothetical protein